MIPRDDSEICRFMPTKVNTIPTKVGINPIFHGMQNPELPTVPFLWNMVPYLRENLRCGDFLKNLYFQTPKIRILMTKNHRKYEAVSSVMFSFQHSKACRLSNSV